MKHACLEDRDRSLTSLHLPRAWRSPVAFLIPISSGRRCSYGRARRNFGGQMPWLRSSPTSSSTAMASASGRAVLRRIRERGIPERPKRTAAGVRHAGSQTGADVLASNTAFACPLPAQHDVNLESRLTLYMATANVRAGSASVLSDLGFNWIEMRFTLAHTGSDLGTDAQYTLPTAGNRTVASHSASTRCGRPCLR